MSLEADKKNKQEKHHIDHRRHRYILAVVKPRIVIGRPHGCFLGSFVTG